MGEGIAANEVLPAHAAFAARRCGPVAAASVVGAEHSGRADVDSAGNIGTTAGFFGANGVTADIVSTAIWEDTFSLD